MRVVPNLYPALADGELDPTPDDPLATGRGEPEMFASRPAVGAHEVIVNSPRAVGSLLELSVDELAEAMDVWRERMRAHDGASYVHVIVNEGREAGASLPHTHAQLYALPFVPQAIARERERFTAYSDRTAGRNLMEDLLQEEVRQREASRRLRLRGRGAVPVRLTRAVPAAARAARAAAALRGSRAARRRRCCTACSAGWSACSARCRRSICGCGPRRAGRSISAGGSI